LQLIHTIHGPIEILFLHSKKYKVTHNELNASTEVSTIP
jgi:hypothetical protein